MAYHSWLDHFGCFSDDTGESMYGMRDGEGSWIWSFWEVLRLLDLMVVRA